MLSPLNINVVRARRIVGSRCKSVSYFIKTYMLAELVGFDPGRRSDGDDDKENGDGNAWRA